MCRSFAALAAWLFGAALAIAQEPIRFARSPDISPDGKTVVFSYLGDLWSVETIGGVARQLTQHEAHETHPAISPDGRSIAFSSNRYGSYDVFVMPIHGGKPTRLTFDSSSDLVTGWTPDGRHILFSSSRTTAFPPGWDLHRVPVKGGPDRNLGIRDAKDAAVSPDGKTVAYSRGSGTWYRKGYRGSSNDDIWLANLDGSNYRRLTDFNGQDTSPMYSADGRTLYYVSEHFGGPANIVALDLTMPGAKPRAITQHRDEAVRRAKISGNGEWIVYECGFDLWVVSPRSGSPRKLAIEVHADDKTNTERRITYSRNITEYALAPDEKHAAIVIHGELFLIKVPDGGKATRLTEHPAFDHNPAWSPDGKRILFLSDRDGQVDIYALDPDDPEHPDITSAHKFKVTCLTHTTESEVGLAFSPDGKKVSFLRAGQLWLMNPDGSDAKALVESKRVFDYDWSPDGKWLVYVRMDGSFASELYVIPVDGSKPPVNVTRYATYNGDVSWSRTGNQLAFIGQRRSGYQMHTLSLSKPAAPGATATSDFDFDDVHLCAVRAAGISAEEGTIAPDGSKVAFRSTGNGDDLWMANSNGSELVRLTSGNTRPKQIRWSKKGFNIFFLDNLGVLRSTRPVSFGSSPAEAARVTFTAKMTYRRDEEYTEMFEQAWRALNDSFYDKTFHGVDWKAIRLKYKEIVPHCSQKEDLYALISLMLGELNASHLGISGPGPTPDEMTADLGLIFDDRYTGPGLKVAEILKRGPADLTGLHLKAGDIIVAIDRTELAEQTNLSQLLNGKVGEMVRLDVLTNPSADPRDPKVRRRIEIRAANRETIHDLMYDRWVRKKAERVAELSKGTLGYIHIPSMDEAGLEKFVRSLYSDNFDKDAIVLDVRFNGGGFTHDQVLNYLTGKEHTVFRQRDGGEGLVLRSFDRKWHKPLVLLINHRSYSDAEIFPSAFRTMNLGKLVGTPTGGAVIGTSSVRLIDGSSFRIPRIGVYTMKGVNMEKEGVQPDVLVEPHPEQIAKGLDPQLDKAVEVLTHDVAEWKKARLPAVTQTSGESRPQATDGR